PLTSMRMAIEMLTKRAGSLDPELASFVGVAHEDVERLTDVAQRFLDLARSRAMTIAVDRKPVELGRVMAGVVKLFGMQATEKNVTLRGPGEVRETVPGDETKITWALSNLVANA